MKKQKETFARSNIVMIYIFASLFYSTLIIYFLEKIIVSIQFLEKKKKNKRFQSYLYINMRKNNYIYIYYKKNDIKCTWW